MLLEIKNLFKKSKTNICRIYYTGHGQTGTCFADGTVSLDEIIKQANNCNYKGLIYLYCDCCFSGNWCLQGQKLREQKNEKRLFIDAACCPGEFAYEEQRGGKFTLHCFTDYKNDKLKWCQLSNDKCVVQYY